MTDDTEFNDMTAYMVIERAKTQILTMIKTTGLIDADVITDEDLREAVTFLYTVEHKLLDDASDAVKIDRLRNLCISLFMLVQTGGDFE